MIKEFLEEYEALCRKYGICLESCGCCDSPWIDNDASEGDIDSALEHLRIDDDYRKELTDEP